MTTCPRILKAGVLITQDQNGSHLHESKELYLVYNLNKLGERAQAPGDKIPWATQK